MIRSAWSAVYHAATNANIEKWANGELPPPADINSPATPCNSTLCRIISDHYHKWSGTPSFTYPNTWSWPYFSQEKWGKQMKRLQPMCRWTLNDKTNDWRFARSGYKNNKKSSISETSFLKKSLVPRGPAREALHTAKHNKNEMK